MPQQIVYFKGSVIQAVCQHLNCYASKCFLDMNIFPRHCIDKFSNLSHIFMLTQNVEKLYTYLFEFPNLIINKALTNQEGPKCLLGCSKKT